MPIYEYKCTECEHTLEKLQKMSDDPLVDCPECGKAGLQKMISAAGFRLKGGGWYSDLYSSAKGGKKDADKSDAAGGGDSKSEKSDKKSGSKKSKSSKDGASTKKGPKAAA